MAKATVWLRTKARSEAVPTEYLTLEIEEVNSGHWWAERPCRRCGKTRGEHEWVLSVGFERVFDCSLEPRTPPPPPF